MERHSALRELNLGKTLTPVTIGRTMPTFPPFPRPCASERANFRRPHVVALTELFREAVFQHYVKLGEDDRYLRFGFSIADAQIEQYTSSLDFSSDLVLGVFDDSELVAVCHAAVAERDNEYFAELGLSVQEPYRGLRLGHALIERSVEEGDSRGWTALKVQYLAQNSAMASLVRKFGATCEREIAEVVACIPLKAAYDVEVSSEHLGVWS